MNEGSRAPKKESRRGHQIKKAGGSKEGKLEGAEEKECWKKKKSEGPIRAACYLNKNVLQKSDWINK
jgi:hypothetical protein